MGSKTTRSIHVRWFIAKSQGNGEPRKRALPLAESGRIGEDCV